MPNYDAIIIGTGQAGPSLARRLAQAGQKGAVIERKLFGGTCVNTGCTPTKTMVASAYAAHLARRGAEFGVEIAGGIKVDMAKVKARKDGVVALSTTGVERHLRSEPNCTVYQGHGRFVSPREVQVGSEVLGAEKIFINVGGRASRPPITGLDQVSYLTNSSMMAVDFLPEHLVIVGGSYIGLEFGQMFRRFGSKVTIVEMMPRLVPREDEDVSAAIADIMTKEGIELRLNATCIHLSRHDKEIAVGVDCADGPPEVVGTHLLMAVGRRANTDDLGLDKAGVAMDPRGCILVDEELRSNVPGIWALGDCNGKGAFTHTAYNDFEIVAGNLLDGEHRRVSDRLPAYALYIDPPLGRAGMTEAEIRKTGRPALTSKINMEDVSRAFEKSETEGFMKIAVDGETRQILGAAFLGVSGDEAIHAVLDLMYAKAPYGVLRRAVHIHPTVSEFIPVLMGSLKPL
jgi:pyruvate/2-oxoglutarate dehydrogenase complex dihydrolipoamide dehydrogenase (E3) component